MASFSKTILSGSVDGEGILLTTTQSPGDLIHTAVASVTVNTFDEIWLWAHNNHTSDLVLTLEFGGMVVPNNTIVIAIPYKAGLIPVVPGFVLQNAKIVTAFASQANLITLTGFVNEIRP